MSTTRSVRCVRSHVVSLGEEAPVEVEKKAVRAAERAAGADRRSKSLDAARALEALRLRPSASKDSSPATDSTGSSLSVASLSTTGSIDSARLRARSQLRDKRRAAGEELLNRFLAVNSFSDISSTIELQSGEAISPIHAAAKLGNAKLVRMLLNLGVDPNQPTSRGRRARDFVATEQRDVLELLQTGERSMQMRDFLELMSSQTV
ncbi:unnamed protein product [Durusdinium trenchii]|uniref:Caskin-2 n=2 Tax=Durusdinium trenchii TaxID=1381693 RepID=A0ABP0P004_9DINO